MLEGAELAAMTDRNPEPRKRGQGTYRRLTETASGLAITAVLALLGLAAFAAVLALLAFFVVGMPLTTAAVTVVLLLGGIAAWRVRRRGR